MPRIALGLEYDGAPFEGWQTQPHGRTVQDHLEHALAQFTQEQPQTCCAGRTDAGVHALAQVVHFDTQCERPAHAWVRGVNRYLPPQVAVRWSVPVVEQFHARFCATARHYEYWIHCAGARAPLRDRRAAWVHRDLDLDAMARAAAHLVGTHDFTSFRSAQCQARTPVRTLMRCEVRAMGDGLVRLRLAADAFLHHMVRNIVGALVEIGAARRPESWLRELLEARDRSCGAPTFAPDGLYLTGVDYPPRWNLPGGQRSPAWGEKES